MRKFDLIFPLLLLFGFALTTVAQQPPQQAPDLSKVQVKVQKLADNVYVLQNSGAQADSGDVHARGAADRGRA